MKMHNNYRLYCSLHYKYKKLQNMKLSILQKKRVLYILTIK